MATMICLPLAACSTTIDRTTISPAQGNYLDAVASLSGLDPDKLETGTFLCELWADLIADGRGLPPRSSIERSVVEGKGASGPNTGAYAEAANQFLCPRLRQSAREVYEAREQRGYYDQDIDPPLESGYEYEYGD